MSLSFFALRLIFFVIFYIVPNFFPPPNCRSLLKELEEEELVDSTDNERGEGNYGQQQLLFSHHLFQFSISNLLKILLLLLTLYIPVFH